MTMLIVDGMSVLKTTAGGMAFLDNGYCFNFFQQLTYVIKKYQPRGIIVCWEGGYDHRTAIFPEYKGGREGSRQEIRDARAQVMGILQRVGVDQVSAPGYEGDDVAGFLVDTLNTEMILMSNDKDWLQLVRPGVSIYQRPSNKARGKTDKTLITHMDFEEMTGWPDVPTMLKAKCAIGDKDEIPGIYGIGEVTVKSYVLGMEIQAAKRQRLDEFYAGSAEYKRNMALIDIRTPHEGIFQTITWNRGRFAPQEALDLLRELGFASLVQKFDTWIEHYKGASLLVTEATDG